MRTLDLILSERRAFAALVLSGAVALLGACSQSRSTTSQAATPLTVEGVPADSGESHLANIRRVTNGGENAEAYFSADGQWLTFQSTRDGRTCDQQYTMRVDGSAVHRVSIGSGKTTCGYFFAGDQAHCSSRCTHAADTTCPRQA